LPSVCPAISPVFRFSPGAGFRLAFPAWAIRRRGYFYIFGSILYFFTGENLQNIAFRPVQVFGMGALQQGRRAASAIQTRCI
jgi:hypothetical protein